MRIEISAGGVVFKKQGKEIRILLLRDQNGNWTFPKGLVEDNENQEITAQREILEETGLENIELVVPLSPIQYWFKWEGDLVKKTVYYYLFKDLGHKKPKPQIAEGISEVKWFKKDEALKIIGYRKTNEKVLKEAIDKIKNISRNGLV